MFFGGKKENGTSYRVALLVDKLQRALSIRDQDSLWVWLALGGVRKQYEVNLAVFCYSYSRGLFISC